MTLGSREDEMPLPLTVREVQERIARVPFSTFLGLRVEKAGRDGIELSMRLRPEMLGNPEVGAIHGGVFASVLDVACSYAVIVQTRHSVITVDLRTDYHRPGFGDYFSVTASIINSGRTLSVAQGEVRNIDGKLIASGRAVVMRPRD